MRQIILSIAYNYVDEPGHEKHWIVQTEPRQFDTTVEEEIDRQDIFLNFISLEYLAINFVLSLKFGCNIFAVYVMIFEDKIICSSQCCIKQTRPNMKKNTV